ncbi:40S ribosomal protein S8 [Morella rubra]|uniref:40S ribosomal protein S8 n=1 Tax=Morella rubra TaxID=262757 RepID=A0A6A1UJR8_9ROSI|nr:40S ribosomal protein S8 [Morella rubra]
MGISRDPMHKRRATGEKKKAWRKKSKYELGRQPASTKLSSNKTVRRIRVDAAPFKQWYIQHYGVDVLCTWVRSGSSRKECTKFQLMKRCQLKRRLQTSGSARDIFAEAAEEGDLERMIVIVKCRSIGRRRNFPSKTSLRRRQQTALLGLMTILKLSLPRQQIQVMTHPLMTDESEDEDVNTKAEILACTKKMLRRSKGSRYG